MQLTNIAAFEPIKDSGEVQSIYHLQQVSQVPRVESVGIADQPTAILTKNGLAAALGKR